MLHLPRKQQIRAAVPRRPRSRKGRRRFAFGSGQDLGAAGGWFETQALAKACASPGRDARIFGHVSLVTNQMGALLARVQAGPAWKTPWKAVLSVAAAPRKPG